MRPSELHRAVARATGESVRQIKRLGFGLVRRPARARRPKPPVASAVTLALTSATGAPVAAQSHVAA